MGSDERDVIRPRFLRAVAAIYDSIGYVRLNEILLQSRVGKVRLWELLVPLRSDCVVDAEVSGGIVNRAVVRRIGSDRVIVKINHSGEIENGACGLNEDFLEKLLLALKAIIEGRQTPGLRCRPRSLIYSPLWTDGWKAEIADIEVLSAINLFKYVVLLGPPGSGKTTAAKAIAAAHLAGFMDPKPGEGTNQLGLWGDYGAFPIYVECKSLVSSKHFPDLRKMPSIGDFHQFIHETICGGDDEINDRVLYYLHEGMGIVILDGLDEVPIPLDMRDALNLRHQQLVGLLDSVKANYPRAKIIVTSRPAGYSGWTLPGFEVVRVHALSTDEAANLARTYYLAAGETPANAKPLSTQFVVKAESLPRGMLEFPLFVCLLAALFRQHKGTFPAQRGALLQASVNLLLGPWTLQRVGGDSIEGFLHCTQDQVFHRLCAVALRGLEESGGGDLSSDAVDIPLGHLLEELYDLGGHVNPREVLEFVTNQAGILTFLPESRRLRFVHRLFQEYLAAEAVASREMPTREMTQRACGNPVLWREVTLLLADVLSNTNRIGDLLLLIEGLSMESRTSVDPGSVLALAAEVVTAQRIAQTVIVRNSAARTTGDRFVDGLKEFLLSGTQRRAIGTGLSEVGDYRKGVGTDSDGTPILHWETIPRGVVQLGSSPEDLYQIQEIVGKGHWNLEREQPKHLIKIAPFCASRYVVTVAQFRAFVDALDGYRNDKWWSTAGKLWRAESGPPRRLLNEVANQPQTRVTWYEAIAFSRWLGNRLSLSVRLPTEPEWEYLAKGNGNTIFPWGQESDPTLANVAESNIGEVVSVGCMRYINRAWPGIELHDLIGNVWEWCSSAVEKADGQKFRYPYNSDDGREEIDIGDIYMRATRGGHYGVGWAMARNAYRGRDFPFTRIDRQGFRVVYTLER